MDYFFWDFFRDFSFYLLWMGNYIIWISWVDIDFILRFVSRHLIKLLCFLIQRHFRLLHRTQMHSIFPLYEISLYAHGDFFYNEKIIMFNISAITWFRLIRTDRHARLSSIVDQSRAVIIIFWKRFEKIERSSVAHLCRYSSISDLQCSVIPIVHFFFEINAYWKCNFCTQINRNWFFFHSKLWILNNTHFTWPKIWLISEIFIRYKALLSSWSVESWHLHTLV